MSILKSAFGKFYLQLNGMMKMIEMTSLEDETFIRPWNCRSQGINLSNILQVVFI